MPKAFSVFGYIFHPIFWWLPVNYVFQLNSIKYGALLTGNMFFTYGSGKQYILNMQLPNGELFS